MLPSIVCLVPTSWQQVSGTQRCWSNGSHAVIGENLFSLSYYTCCCFLVSKSCLTLGNPMNCSMPGFPVLHYSPEFAQTHIHWIGDAIQPSHPLSPPSPPALNLSQHQGLFQESHLFTSGGQSIEASASASALPMNIQGWFPLGLTGLIFQSKGLSRVFWIQALYQIWICKYFLHNLACLFLLLFKVSPAEQKRYMWMKC